MKKEMLKAKKRHPILYNAMYCFGKRKVICTKSFRRYKSFDDKLSVVSIMQAKIASIVAKLFINYGYASAFCIAC